MERSGPIGKGLLTARIHDPDIGDAERCVLLQLFQVVAECIALGKDLEADKRRRVKDLGCGLGEGHTDVRNPTATFTNRLNPLLRPYSKLRVPCTSVCDLLPRFRSTIFPSTYS